MTKWSLIVSKVNHLIQVYTPTTNVEEAEVEQFYEDLQDLLELTPKNRCPFHHRGLEWKSRKSRDNWRNEKIWPWSTKWSRAEGSRILPKECTGMENTFFQQHKRWFYSWTSPRWSISKSDWLYYLQWKTENTIQSAKTRLRADSGSDHELLIAKFRPKLKKVGKTTRPFRCDLNQIPYDYTVEVTIDSSD